VLEEASLLPELIRVASSRYPKRGLRRTLTTNGVCATRPSGWSMMLPHARAAYRDPGIGPLVGSSTMYRPSP
jgi:hypothetical protein